MRREWTCFSAICSRATWTSSKLNSSAENWLFDSTCLARGRCRSQCRRFSCLTEWTGGCHLPLLRARTLLTLSVMFCPSSLWSNSFLQQLCKWKICRFGKNLDLSISLNLPFIPIVQLWLRLRWDSASSPPASRKAHERPRTPGTTREWVTILVDGDTFLKQTCAYEIYLTNILPFSVPYKQSPIVHMFTCLEHVEWCTQDSSVRADGRCARAMKMRQRRFAVRSAVWRKSRAVFAKMHLLILPSSPWTFCKLCDIMNICVIHNLSVDE